jgi:16S rRNA (cytidine1402-2'-O)-methyltransferase
VSGTLFLVPVPIGHRDDITLRAIEVLRGVDLVAAEDTRDFRELRRRHAIGAPVISYHDHNERARTPELVTRLQEGKDVALVSDAGTPLVSDPGYRLVRACIDAGIRVASLPGASAVTTALAASGLPPHPFRFCGFPPRTSGRRRSLFAALRDDDATLILYEAPHRLVATLRDAQAILGERRGCLARNLTKPHERYQRGTLGELLAVLRGEGEVRGEATLLIAGVERGAAGEAGGGESPGAAAAERAARLLLREGVGQRPLLALLTREYGMRRREAYQLLLRLET